MAVQAQLYPENLGYLPPMCGVQDWSTINPVPAVATFDSDHLCFTLHQDPQHQQQQQQQQQQLLFGHHHHNTLQQNHQTLGFDCNIRGFSSSSSASTVGGGGSNCLFSSMALSQSLGAQLELQRQEIDCILQIQSERLRSVLQEQRRKQQIVLLKSMESKAVNMMRRKEEDLVQASNKTMELEACLREVEMESEKWQRLAKENEAMVIDLSNTLEQVREKLVLVANTADDAQSSFSGSCNNNNQHQQQEMMISDSSSKKKSSIACKRCISRSPCMLFLPCRHLCSCKQCEPFLVSCPVCKSAKEASMEVFWV